MTESDERRQRASMRKVAERADVAISSVSRVLSGHPDVSDAMRARVLAAVEELEYQPDFLAQSLRRGQTLSVGFVLGDISNPLLAKIVLGAESELRRQGYSLLLMNSETDPQRDVHSVGFFQTRRVDAMLLSIVDETYQPLLEALRSVTVPMVMVDRELAGENDVSVVTADHAGGMRAAVAHLIGLGHRNIALLGGSRGTLPARERELGLREAAAASPSPVQVDVLEGAFSAEHGAAATQRLLERTEPPTAVACGSNQVLVGCLSVLNARGITVGQDMSLVTCDDVAASEVYRPAIASISRDTVGLGRSAAEVLLRQMREGGPTERLVLPTTFTPRASCAAPRKV